MNFEEIKSNLTEKGYVIIPGILSQKFREELKIHFSSGKVNYLIMM